MNATLENAARASMPTVFEWSFYTAHTQKNKKMCSSVRKLYLVWVLACHTDAYTNADTNADTNAYTNAFTNAYTKSTCYGIYLSLGMLH